MEVISSMILCFTVEHLLFVLKNVESVLFTKSNRTKRKDSVDLNVLKLIW